MLAPAANRSLSSGPLLSIQMGGLPIVVINRDESAKLMIAQALAQRGSDLPPLVITSANGQVISMCAREAAIQSLFLKADLIHADGMPIVLASRLRCEIPLPQRVATTDLFHDVARLAGPSGASFYLLGATRATMQAAVARIRRMYPDLTIAGYRHGYSRRDGDEEQMLSEINSARPDILWIGMGAPLELAFALRNRERLTNVGLIKTSGGLFDFLSGRNSRAPDWMQSAGLEWLYRLALEPRRLFYRYLTTNPHALYLLLAGKRPTPGEVHLRQA